MNVKLHNKRIAEKTIELNGHFSKWDIFCMVTSRGWVRSPRFVRRMLQSF